MCRPCIICSSLFLLLSMLLLSSLLLSLSFSPFCLFCPLFSLLYHHLIYSLSLHPITRSSSSNSNIVCVCVCVSRGEADRAAATTGTTASGREEKNIKIIYKHDKQICIIIIMIMMCSSSIIMSDTIVIFKFFFIYLTIDRSTKMISVIHSVFHCSSFRCMSSLFNNRNSSSKMVTT